MTTVQLGWLQDILDWVTDNIIVPVFNFLADIFTVLLEQLFDILGGLLEIFFKGMTGLLKDTLLEVFYRGIYKIMRCVLLAVEGVETSFNIFSGIEPVYKKVAGGGRVKMNFIMALFSDSIIQKAIGIMIAVGFSLCLLSAIIATVKSMLQLDLSRGKGVGHVMRLTFKAMLYYILLPLASTVIILISTIVLNNINEAFTKQVDGSKGKTSIARILFCISAMDAVDTDKYPEDAAYNISTPSGVEIKTDNSGAVNSSSKDQGVNTSGQNSSADIKKEAVRSRPEKFGITDKYRGRFYLAAKNESRPLFYNMDEVEKYFKYSRIDYTIGLLLGIFFLIAMCMALFVFIGRVFDVLLLLFVSPIYIATMPLDEGKMFSKWSDLFVGKLFSGFGLVAGIRLYLTITEMLFSNEIAFVDPTSNQAIFQNYLINLIFMMGGAFALKNTGPLVTNILSFRAAEDEQVRAQFGSAIATKGLKTTGKFMGKVGVQTLSVSYKVAKKSLGVGGKYAWKGVKKGAEVGGKYAWKGLKTGGKYVGKALSPAYKAGKVVGKAAGKVLAPPLSAAKKVLAPPAGIIKKGIQISGKYTWEGIKTGGKYVGKFGKAVINKIRGK
ncbi:MAG: hypothetical protein K5894_07445 [Lachnospiraceae bacterium]|nr:hypothetical protein [Lachnospiraceae bacterium]